MTRLGGSSRGGSNGMKYIPSKIVLVPKAGRKNIVSKNHKDMKRDGRFMQHRPSHKNDHFRFTHLDINVTDSRDNQKATRSINLRAAH